MAGTSPYNFQSPSFHSSSYLPKMEANFMKDYVCCGITLDSLHELLQHYEEAHAQVPTQTMGRTPKDQQTYPDGRAANATNAAALLQQDAQQQGADQPFSARNNNLQQYNTQHSGLSQGLGRDPLTLHQDMDDLDAMEMDDTMVAPAVQSPQQQFHPQPQFGRQQSRAPQLNTGMGNMTPSAPSTPQPGQNYPMQQQHNPTVSSVNTPTFGQNISRINSPDIQAPRTPGELELDYSIYGNAGMNTQAQQEGIDFSSLNLGSGDLTIDEPAKRLLSKQGFGGLKTGLANSQFSTNSELAKRMREQQMLHGFETGTGFPSEEVKPFKCPVIGCEKAYKNQNGLKYHKQVSVFVLIQQAMFAMSLPES